MCHFASMIVTKGHKVFWSKDHDSHSDIRREHGLPENGVGYIASVQIEYCPRYSNMSNNMADWVWRVDQDLLPDWWNEADAKAACWEALPALCKARNKPMINIRPTRVRIPDGYERCPEDYVLRAHIDLGPVYTGGLGCEPLNMNTQKKPYKYFQWVNGWGGKTVGDLVGKCGLAHKIFIRPKVKKTK